MEKINYNFKTTEKKWKQIWEENKVYQTSPVNNNLKKYYILEMFPYPSGKIHMGHIRNYTLGDVLARYKKACGFNVLHPMGWDSFGLPAENAAKEFNIHPEDWTLKNIEEMKTQLQNISLSIDWSKELSTCSPNYYKHSQSLFIDFYNHNLTYRKKTFVNYDEVEETVLANEQIIDGKGWRSGSPVVQKELNQWFLKITDFAEDLLQDIEILNKNWPQKVLDMQTNWIGKSKGCTIKFKISNSIFNNFNSIEIFTTKPETIYGASFLAISPQHPLSLELSKTDTKLQTFINEFLSLGTSLEAIEKNEKKGYKTNLTAINPITNEVLPIYIANFVLMDYALGAIFGCPAHDKRDFDFATKYNLKIKQVITLQDNNNTTIPLLYDKENTSATLINSNELNNLNIKDAFTKICNIIETSNYGKITTKFKLKDWGISRQRYWGCPIPIIYCKTCGTVTEKKENLPITLPKDINLNSKGNPLNNHPTWKHINCPYCNNKAERETDTFDTFFESSWYFLRFTDTNNQNNPFTKENLSYFMPVDKYIGGIEHAIMHLLYSRFFTKALIKMNIIPSNIKEPFTSLITQGMVCHKTYKDSNNKWAFPNDVIQNDKNELIHKDTKLPITEGRSEKMSKSKKNIVDPTIINSLYGADSIRLFVLSDTPPEKNLEWTDSGIEGIYRFINKLWNLHFHFINKNFSITYLDFQLNIKDLSQDETNLYIELNQIILKTKTTIEEFNYNKSIANLREFINYIEESINNPKLKESKILTLSFHTIIILFHYFIPHITEEIWQNLKNTKFLYQTDFPNINESFLEKNNIDLAIQISGKTKGTINVTKNLTKEEIIDIIKINEKFSKYIINQEFKKIIHVQNKIINFVI
jgi:leucyl-tRNA synthetase